MQANCWNGKELIPGKEIGPFLSDFRCSPFQTAGGETKGAGGGVKASFELGAGSRAVGAQ